MKVLRLVLVAAVCIPAACDWFEEPVEANLHPETRFLACASGLEVFEGDDVRFEWVGSDVDGTVNRYECAYDGSPWTSTAGLDTIISDVTLGEHTLRVRSVDDHGDVDPTPAECSFTVTEPGSSVDRVVHLELFTATWCRFCPKAEIALNSLLDEYGPDRLSVIAFHGTPDRDPFATEETEARIIWHFSDPSFPGDRDVIPTVVIDGLRYVQGAATAEEAEAYYRAEIELRMALGSPLSIRTVGEIGSSTGLVSAVVKVEDHLEEGDRLVRFAVIEDDIFYIGPYSLEYDFVSRDLPADEPFDLVVVGDSMTVERQFSVDGSWNPEHMDVIVFVQDMTTREVLQSARLRRE
ncbi:MAG: hypothetical protein ABIJ00_03780 [Candidatus Eisenbacteria bacterium]